MSKSVGNTLSPAFSTVQIAWVAGLRPTAATAAATALWMNRRWKNVLPCSSSASDAGTLEAGSAVTSLIVEIDKVDFECR